MQIKTFREKMLTDVDYAVSYIVKNNAPAVADRLQTYGFSVSDDDSIFEALNELLSEGRLAEFREALSVPMRTDAVDPAQLAVVSDVAKGMAQAGRAQRSTKMAPVWPPTLDEFMGSGPAATAEDSDGTSPGTGFANVFGAIIGGLTAVLGAVNGKGSVQQVPTDGAANNARAEADAAKQKRNRYILIGVGVVLLIVVAVFAIKAWRK